jgi:hypothetical protein
MLVHIASVFAVAAFAADPPKEASFEQKAKDFAATWGASLCGDAQKCRIKVNVLPGCVFTVTPWTLGLPRGNGNVKIHWVIDAASAATFDKEKGIYFKSTGSNQEFSDPTPVSPKEFRWNDKNPQGTTRPRPHNYAIKVSLGKESCLLDPTIVNDY